MGKIKIAHKGIVFAALSALLLLGCGNAWALPTTPYQAEQVVTGWLATDAQPLGTTIGRHISRTEIFTGDDGEPIYYVVYLQPTGFVIVSADDLVEPIIAFADDGTYDCSPANPLAALVHGDLGRQVRSRRASAGPQGAMMTVSHQQRKWNRFIRLAETSQDSLTLMSMSSIPDVRVAPLLQSKWAQGDVCGQNCFNYYTPNHYYCGCVATAMAQLMRYQQHPRTAIGVHRFTVKVEGDPQTLFTRGGNGLGGQYNWSDMPLVPNCQTTDAQRQAIGALCYDAGIAVNVDYAPDSSSGDALKAKDALIDIFRYSNAVNGYNKESNIGPGLLGMINPNLDYANPVIIGVWREENGHAVVCDGYGYSTATLYHHLNMGWGGADDAWYNLPNVDAQYQYTSVAVCVYNIFVSGKGEIISGRVTDARGAPISAVTVTAEGPGGPYITTSNANGIYALAKIPSASTYTVTAEKEGCLFTEQTVSTGTSRDEASTSGNKWAVDFVAALAGDCDADNDVDAVDLAIFARSWLTAAGDPSWNPYCDISVPRDGLIDTLDLAVFVDNWLAGAE